MNKMKLHSEKDMPVQLNSSFNRRSWHDMGLWHHAMLFEFCLSVMKMKRYDNTRRELRSTGRCSIKDVCTNSMLRRIFLNRNLIIINKRVVKKNTNEYDISWLGSRPCAFFGGIIFEYEWRHGSFLYFKVPISDHKFQENGIWNYWQNRVSITYIFTWKTGLCRVFFLKKIIPPSTSLSVLHSNYLRVPPSHHITLKEGLPFSEPWWSRPSCTISEGHKSCHVIAFLF